MTSSQKGKKKRIPAQPGALLNHSYVLLKKSRHPLPVGTLTMPLLSEHKTGKYRQTACVPGRGLLSGGWKSLNSKQKSQGIFKKGQRVQLRLTSLLQTCPQSTFIPEVHIWAFFCPSFLMQNPDLRNFPCDVVSNFQVQWCIPLVPALQEADTGGFLSSKTAQSTE